MTAAGIDPGMAPKLRPDIVLGPALADGLRVIHHMKDPRTGWFYRIGPREFFVISRLDGQRSLGDIGREYATAFGKNLGERNWQQILTMLARRHLLAGTDDAESIAALAAAARSQSRGHRRLLLYRRPLFSPDRLFGWLEPRVSFLFSAWFVLPGLAAVAALETVLIIHGTGLWREARHGLSGGPVLAASIVTIWLMMVLHESAHGMTCKHFGGSAPEIGIIWRFPILAPYCKADDVVLFGRRRHRVYTAFAGIFAGLLALLPFGLLWALTPPGAAARDFAAAVLVMGNGMTLMNLIPFLQLDGYFMLNHALGMVNLRASSYRFCGQLARRAVGRGPGVGMYPRSARRAFLAYGAASLIYGAALLARFVIIWFLLLHNRIGVAGSVALLAGVLVGGAVLGLLSTLRNRHKAYHAAPGVTALVTRKPAPATAAGAMPEAHPAAAGAGTEWSKA